MDGPNTETQHVVPTEDGKWGVRAESSQTPSKLFESKLAAVSRAFDIASNHEGKVVIHRKDGTFKNFVATEEKTKFVALLQS